MDMSVGQALCSRVREEMLCGRMFFTACRVRAPLLKLLSRAHQETGKC